MNQLKRLSRVCMVIFLAACVCSCSGIGGNSDGSVDASNQDGEHGQDIDPSQFCVPEAGVLFSSSCAEPAEPDWVARGENTVWVDADGTIFSVAASQSVSASLARTSAMTRAYVLVFAHLEGVAPGTDDCLLEAPVTGSLSCTEGSQFYFDGVKTWALARRAADPETEGCPVAAALLSASCPDPPALPHLNDCQAPALPLWINRQAFNGLDGYLYGVGQADAADPIDRAQTRARSAMLGYLYSFEVNAGPDNGACPASASSMGSISEIEYVFDIVEGDHRYSLARRWIGLPN